MRDITSVSQVSKIRSTSKVSNDSIFKKGQKFDARIISISEDKASITLKLRDGSEVVAKVEGKIDDGLNGFMSFESLGFEDGSLKLKLSQKSVIQTKNQDSLDIVLENLGLDSSKKEILSKMLEFNISLTKSNVEKFITLLDFRDKSNFSTNQIDIFINRYLSSKNMIDEIQSISAKDKLIEFFDAFKNMADDEILLFLENDVEFNKNNIDSYNKIFKNSEIFKSIENLKKFTDVKDESDKNVLEKIQDFSLDMKCYEILKNQKNNIPKEIIEPKIELIEKQIILNENNIDINIKQENIKNITIDNLLIKENEILKDIIKNIDKTLNLDRQILDKNITKQTLKELTSYIKLENIEIREGISNLLKDNLQSFEQKFNGNLSSKDVDIARNLFKWAKDEIQSLVSNNQDLVRASKINFSEAIGAKSIDMFLNDFRAVKVSLEQRQTMMKDILAGISEKILNGDSAASIIMSTLKSSINDFKIFNDFNDNYYYLDIPLKLEEEYPMKLIIKDDRKNGSLLDSSKIKLVVIVSTIKLGNIDAFIDINKKNLKLELVSEDKAINMLEKNKESLIKSLELLGFSPYILLSKKKEVVENDIVSYRNFFSCKNNIGIDKKV